MNPKRKAPQAEVRPTRLQKHGDVRIDDYFWLKERKNPKVKAHLKAENKYLEAQMASTKGLQSKLVKELRSRIKEDDQSAPYKKGDYFYFSKYKKNFEYPIYLRRKAASRKYFSAGTKGFSESNFAPSTKNEVLMDVNKAARGHKFYDVASLAISFQQDRMVYSADTVGRRLYDLHFKDLKTGKSLAKPIKNTTGNVVWLNDNNTILYTVQDHETLRAYRVYKYTIGGRKPELVYEEKDPQFYVSVSKDLSKNYVYIFAKSNSCSEVRFANAYQDSTLDFKVFWPREKKHEYSIADGEDCFFILSNSKAKNFQVLKTAKNKLAKKHWLTVVKHRSSVLIEDLLVLKKYIVLEERKNGLTQLTHFKRNSNKALQILFPDPTYVAGLGVNAEYNTDVFRYDYQSMTQPQTTFDYSFATNRSVVVKSETVPNYNPKLYKSERFFAPSPDGAKIPVSIVYKKSLLKKSRNPLYVYAYGSYGLSTNTYFRRGIVSLLDRGFVFAIAHIRGGSDLGRLWYEDGKLLKKKNTFNDFVIATESLLDNGYGKRNHVYAMGGSAGGLLMGAVLNQRPDLYRGVIAAVPFVDVVTTMLDDTIPLTTNEYDEWGNPNDKKFYKYIKSYSPYDNVRAQNYPNILVTTGFHDSQVQYWEPAKWIAKIRRYNTSTNLILFKTDMTSGHSGTTGRFESLKEDALEYAFFLMLEGLN